LYNSSENKYNHPVVAIISELVKLQQKADNLFNEINIAEESSMTEVFPRGVYPEKGFVTEIPFGRVVTNRKYDTKRAIELAN
jgi:hypothetical protein